jgi:PAS domain S-box-containing protein
MVEPPRRTSHRDPPTGAELLRASPTPAFLVSPELQVTVANPALARLLGYEPSAALEGPADRLVVAEERIAVRDVLRGTRDPAAAVASQAVTMARADGAAAPTRWRVVEVREAGELLVLVDAEPDRRDSRHDLPGSDRIPADLLLQVFDAIPDPALLYVAPDKIVLDVNAAWCAGTGYDRAEMRGSRLDQLDIWHDPAERAAFHERFDREGRVRDFAMRFRQRGDKGVRDAIVSAEIMRQPGREVMLVVARDVTAERAAEERLRHAQRLEVLGRLAGSVAHDYNNVLSVIAGYALELGESFASNDPRQDDVAEIQQAVRRAAGLTRQLLAFGRKSTHAPRVLDLNTLVPDLRPLLARVLGPDIRLRVVRAPAPALVLADPTAIEQVLVNLAVNARDAMPAGGRLVVALSHVVDSPPPPDVAPGSVPPRGYVRLAVRDTGIGMDERTRARIFEPYFTTKDADRGSGLGLSTVHGIVLQSGGRLDVDTAPGAGTTFRVDLPAVNPADGGGELARPERA